MSARITWTVDAILEHCAPIPECGCFVWLRATFRNNNYPWIQYKPGHRFMYELAKGAIPAGAHVLHRCDVPTCLNPTHLYLGTHAQNMADRKRRGHYGAFRR